MAAGRADSVQISTLDEQFDFNATDLTKQFDQLLRTRRINDLEEQARAPRSSSQTSPNSAALQRPTRHDRQPIDPRAHSSYQQTPLVPCQPQDERSLRFRNLLLNLSTTPMQYENPGLLDEALTHIPLNRIYAEAEEETAIMRGLAISKGPNVKPDWGYQDCVVRSLLKWFKAEFFTFLYNPTCSLCTGPTAAEGLTIASPEEAARGARNVELYRCQNQQCQSYERFPRYSQVWPLLQTRRGRQGEFANCFAMLCRAVSARVRWVWTPEDAFWVEVYSEHKRRWIHVDPCEEKWDEPRIYAEAWSRKFSYIIAFGNDGATDVTRRYIRNHEKHGNRRTRAREEEVLWMMLELRKIRRENMLKPEQQRLRAEDEREERELRACVAQALTHDMMSGLPGTRTTQDNKHLQEQQFTSNNPFLNQRQQDGQ